MPEIEPGADLAAAIGSHIDIADGDVVVVTSKIVSKAEGRSVELSDVEPSPFAREWGTAWDKDPRLVEVVLRESVRIVRQVGPVLITETRHGFVCANSGVDQSSSGASGRVLMLPVDPDGSARRLRRGLQRPGVDVAVIVTDTFGRPWREGQTDVAIGVAGIAPLHSYIGQHDPHGHEFQGAGDVRCRRAGGGGRARQGQHEPGAGGDRARLRLGARRARRRWRLSSARRDATCSADVDRCYLSGSGRPIPVTTVCQARST